ncbi:MAG TPA: pilus assembly protein N-terminal domain-containing protein, partial [Aestuariivirga sp.]|nr:pilus assembly protein N-terminal domain-containing protein [Aestuariivirga sp.]
MFLKSFKPAVSAMKISRFALVAAIAVTSLTGLWLAGVPTGYASDLDTPMSADASGANFLRIGLNKSVVLRLPADAKDVLVGNPDIVDAVVRTRNTAYLFARAVGQTNIFFFDANGQQILNLDIEVAQDMTALQKLIKRTLPGSRITVDMIGNNVILGGIAATPAEAKTAEDLAKRFGGDVLNTIKVATESQVMLKVRIAEVQRDVLKKLGVNFSQLAFDAGKFAFSLPMHNTFPNVTSTSLKGTVGYAGNNPSANASIEALEGTGLLRTL